MENFKFQASPNPFRSLFDFYINFRKVRKMIIPKNRIFLLGFYFFLFLAGLVILSSIFESKDRLLLISALFLPFIFAFAIIFSRFLDLLKNSLIFNVNAITINSEDGVGLEYRNGSKEFIEYRNIIDVKLNTKFDFGYLVRFYPSHLKTHFSLILKNGASQREIPLSLNIPQIFESINLIKEKSNINKISIEGAKVVSFAVQKPLSKGVLITIFIVLILFSLWVAYLSKQYG